MESGKFKVGRGGAGNIYSPKAVQEAESASQDIEEQDREAVTDAILATRAPAQYVHAGRGGAGNLRSPADAPRTEAFTSTSEVINNASKFVQGRGGAGNIGAARETAQKPSPSETAPEKDAPASEEALNETNEGIREPEQAHLGEGRPASHSLF